MSDQQLLSTLRDVNPIPDPDQLLVEEAEARAFVAAVQGVRMVPLARPVGLRTRRRWLVAVAAAAAVFILVSGAGLLLRVTGSETPVATTPPIDSFSSLTWSRVPYDEAAFGGEYEQWMSSVTVGGPGLVAVGGGDTEAAVWTSPDGITWSRVPLDETVFGGAEMSSVTAGGPGLVAVGGGDTEAAVWTSPDGITWSRVPHDEGVFGRATMSSVTVGGPGLVAVGFDGSPQGERSNAVVWTSPDGITWSRVPYNEAIFGGIHVGMSSVTAGGPGLVAVGWDWPGWDWPRAAVWTSPDGITWSRVPHDEAVFGGEVGLEMRSVTVGGPGLVAVGFDGHHQGERSNAVVWTSPDGITWSRVPHDEAVFGGEVGLEMRSVVSVSGPGLVAVGWDSMGAVVWISVDGITWSRVPQDEAVFGARPDRPALEMRSVTAGGPGLVAVGAHGVHPTSGPTDSDAAVWNASVRD